MSCYGDANNTRSSNYKRLRHDLASAKNDQNMNGQAVSAYDAEAPSGHHVPDVSGVQCR